MDRENERRFCAGVMDFSSCPVRYTKCCLEIKGLSDVTGQAGSHCLLMVLSWKDALVSSDNVHSRYVVSRSCRRCTRVDGDEGIQKLKTMRERDREKKERGNWGDGEMERKKDRETRKRTRHRDIEK